MCAKYVFYPKRMEKSILSIRSAFEARFNDFLLAYSFKTNSYGGVLEQANRLGLFAEVVSPEEFNLAVENNWPRKNMIYNGVCKDGEQIIQCSTAGGIVNIDNQIDLDIAEDYFRKNGRPLKIGVRLNFDVGNKIKSRFGVHTNGALYNRILKLNKDGIIKVKGLSCHFTATKEAHYWKTKARNLSENARNFGDVEYLDFGGSLGNAEQTADALYEELKLQGMEDRKIIIESGTAVVSPAFDVESTVLHITENSVIVVDTSMMDMMLSVQGDSIQFETVHTCPDNNRDNNRGEKVLHNGMICGYTCLENDIIKKGYNGKLSKGDKIIFKNTGAYTYAMASNFIKPVMPVEVRG